MNEKDVTQEYMKHGVDPAKIFRGSQASILYEIWALEGNLLIVEEGGGGVIGTYI